MDEIMIDGIEEGMNMPFFAQPQFDSISLPYTDPSNSFWVDKSLSSLGEPVVRARVTRVDKETGLISVVGIDADINIDVPITSNFAGTDFHGDVSLPARGWEVILIRACNGDYYPIKYKRPYSEKDGWSHKIPDEVEPGDWGITTSGGARLLAFDSGLVQMESSPSCLRTMTSVDEDERIEDICRRYGLHSDAGKFIASEYENSPLQASRIELQANSKMAAVTNPVARIKMGSLDESGTMSGFEAVANDMSGNVEVASLRMNNLGVSELNSDHSLSFNAKRVALGSTSAAEPVPLGTQLMVRITEIESRISALQASIVSHTHIVPLPTPASPTPTGPGVPLSPSVPITGLPSFLSKTCYVI